MYYPGEVLTEVQAQKNREIVYAYLGKFPRKGKRKIKKFFIYSMFVISIRQPLAPCAAVVLPPPTPINRLHSIDESTINTTRNSPRPAQSFAKRPDKIVFSEKAMVQFYDLAARYRNNSVTRKEAIRELRGGGLSDWLVLFIFVYMIANHTGESFLQAPLPHMDPVVWINGNYNHPRFPGQSKPEFSFCKLPGSFR